MLNALQHNNYLRLVLFAGINDFTIWMVLNPLQSMVGKAHLAI